MDHTVVVLTHADVGFEKRSLEEYIADLPDKKEGHIKMVKDSGSVTVIKTIPMKKFLTEEVCEHVMAVNNNYKREYERVKQRDALIEHVDVILLKNGGKCFKNKYFDKAEEKLKEREEKEEILKTNLLVEEIKEWRTANNKAKVIANGISGNHLKELQWEGMKKEKERPDAEVVSSIKPRFDDMRKAIRVLLKFGEADPSEPLKNIVNGIAVKCALFRIKCIEDQKQDEEINRQAQEKQAHEQEEEELRKKIEAQGSIRSFFHRKEGQVMRQRHEEESAAEKQKYEQMMEHTRNIKKSLIRQKLEINEITKGEKDRLAEHISREGCAVEDFELALGYAREAALLIADEHINSMELPQLQGIKPEDKITSAIRVDVRKHLDAMIKMLEKMKEFSKKFGANYDISDKIVEECFHKLFPLMKLNVDVEHGKDQKSMRQVWQEKLLKPTREKTKKNPADKEMSLNQYETATAYARLLALHEAEKVIDRMTADEITRRISDLTRGGLRKENDDKKDAIQRNTISTEDISLDEEGASGDKIKRPTTSFITEITTEDLVKKVEEEMKYILKASDEGTNILELLIGIKSWNGELILQKLTKESLTEEMFFKLMEIEHQPNLVQARRAHRMQLLASCFNSLECTDNVPETQNYDLVKLYVFHAAEYLMETHLKHVRAKEIKQEDNTNFTNSVRWVTKKMYEDLKKDSQETIQYFTRYITPEGKLNSIEIIAMFSVQTIGRKMIMELENDLSNQLRLEELFKDFNVQCVEEHRKKLIEGQIEILTHKIKSLAPEYAKSKNVTELDEMASTEYKQEAQDLTPLVRKQLPDETKHFFSDEKVGEAIKSYAKLHHETLKSLGKEVVCFPSDAMVTEEKRGAVKMSELRVGDRILTAQTDGRLIYEDVFMFGHADRTTEYTYIGLHTEDNNSLLLSKGHLLHVGCHGNLKAAQEVTIGDVVLVTSRSRLQQEVVTRITTVVKEGAYCPHTTGGSLIVNNILASSFTDVINHQVAYAMLLPARMLYHVLPSGVFNWMFPYDETEGMPKLLLKMKNLYQLMW